MTFDWMQRKTGKMKCINVFTERDDFVVDSFHGLFCRLVLTSTSTLNSEFVFDDLKAISGNKCIATTRLNAAFDLFYEESELAKSVAPGLTTRVRSPLSF